MGVPDAATESQSIREAITEAVSDSEFLRQLQEDADDLGLGDPAGDPAAGEGQSSTSDGQEGTEGSEDPLAGVTDDELPDSYWGTSLEGLSAEQKRSVIAALEQRDSTIQQLQTRLAQEPKVQEAPPASEGDEDISDDDILRALDIDPEGDAFEVEQARKTVLPLAKTVIRLEETVERMSQTEEIRETATAWNMELDKLENQYGKLPGDRVRVLQYAAEEGIANPEVLYFRLTAPSKQAVEAEIAKVRQTQAKKAQAGGIRPRNVDAGAKVLDTKGLSLRDTVRAAALQAQEETGKRWKDILGPEHV